MVRKELNTTNLVSPDGQWRIIDTFAAQATTGNIHTPQIEKITAALLVPRQFTAHRFEMRVAQINKKLEPSEFIYLKHHDGFQLIAPGIPGVYFLSGDDALKRATQRYAQSGHAEKIDKLEQALLGYYSVIADRNHSYLPVWREISKRLAPLVAAFYLTHPEPQQKI